jgi:hypothetical protein
MNTPIITDDTGHEPVWPEDAPEWLAPLLRRIAERLTALPDQTDGRHWLEATAAFLEAR